MWNICTGLLRLQTLWAGTWYLQQEAHIFLAFNDDLYRYTVTFSYQKARVFFCDQDACGQACRKSCWLSFYGLKIDNELTPSGRLRSSRLTAYVWPWRHPHFGWLGWNGMQKISVLPSSRLFQWTWGCLSTRASIIFSESIVLKPRHLTGFTGFTWLATKIVSSIRVNPRHPAFYSSGWILSF